MRFYIVLQGPKGLSKKKELEALINARSAVNVFRVNGAHPTTLKDVRAYKNRFTPRAGNEIYIVDANCNGQPSTNLTKVVGEKNAINLHIFLSPQVQKINKVIVSKNTKFNSDSSDNDQKETTSVGYSMTAKLSIGALASALIGVLFAAIVVPAAVITNTAANIGVSLAVANAIVFGTAGIAAALTLTAMGFSGKVAYDYFFKAEPEAVLNKKQYDKELKKENKAVTELEKALKSKAGNQIRTKFEKLFKAAPARQFGEDGEPVADNKLVADKLVVRQWEHKKLDKLAGIEDKEAKAQYEAKILKKEKFAAK